MRLQRWTSLLPIVSTWRIATKRLSTLPSSEQETGKSTFAGPSPKEDPTSEGSDVITPWNVESRGPKGINYNRVRDVFHAEAITAPLLSRYAQVTKKNCTKEEGPQDQLKEAVLPPFLRRGFVFSHRDFDKVLDEVEKGRQFYLYTGRGPSALTMHLGHALPMILCKQLQDAFHCPMVIQITDDEKFLFRDIPLEKMGAIATNNIKDIIAFGFDPRSTFIFRNTSYMGEMYPTVLELQRLFTVNAVKHTFGFDDSDSVGKLAFAATQAAPCFVSSFRRVLPIRGNNMMCLVPCAIDQDPYFVLTRSVCDRLKRRKPAVLHTTFVPALKGATRKMSSSAEQDGVILLTDNRDTVRAKVKRAFSGGKGTLEELRATGADLDADVAVQLLRYYQWDDAALKDIETRYQTGRATSGEVKELAADAVSKYLETWQARRACVTDADVDKFCSVRDVLTCTMPRVQQAQ